MPDNYFQNSQQIKIILAPASRIKKNELGNEINLQSSPVDGIYLPNILFYGDEKTVSEKIPDLNKKTKELIKYFSLDLRSLKTHDIIGIINGN